MCSTPYGITGLGSYQKVKLKVWTISAQRLTASQVWADLDLRDRVLMCMCSTPYGITGLGSSEHLSPIVQISKCSTPYGITGLGRMNKREKLYLINVCSTPYGITGLGSYQLSPQLLLTLLVLNALRHHRFGQSQSELVGFAVRRCAQRLTASQVWAGVQIRVSS